MLGGETPPAFKPVQDVPCQQMGNYAAANPHPDPNPKPDPDPDPDPGPEQEHLRKLLASHIKCFHERTSSKRKRRKTKVVV